MPLRSTPRVALIVLALGACLAGSAAGVDAAQTGVNVAPTSGDYFVSPSVHRAIERLHPAWVRVFMGWNALESAPGVYNTAILRNYHAFFASLPRGTRVDLDLEGTPAWASGSTDIATPPRDPGSFAAFARFIASTFRGQVSAYEIGDEEDTPSGWHGSVAQFAALLHAAYPAIKAVDPTAQVIAGGLAGNDYQYLQALYGAGGGGAFDAVAVHTDDACNVTSPTVFAFDRGTQTINRYYFLGFTSVHAVMAAHGDGAKPIMMSEIGWSSTSAQCQTGAWAGRKAAGVPPATQAAFLEQAYRCLAEPRFGYVEAALWFGLFDNAVGPAMNDNYGLLTHELTSKPAYGAFLSVSRHPHRLRAGCGSLAGPALKVISPSPGQRYGRALLVKVVARARGVPIASIELRAGGRRILSFHGGAATTRGAIRWHGARRLPAGRQTITLVARAVNGTATRKRISVVHR